MAGPENYNGPKEVWSAPSAETFSRNLRIVIEEGWKVLSSHEPLVKEVHDAFTELGDRLQEAEEVLATILELQKETDRDQTEINYTLAGAALTKTSLIKAILLAKQEIEK
ncbi:hypothetical protein EXS56_00065 [Candidatus Kaiserbacteria bacterium]|nr:hypothetical protein [Candidatus Kaiserbacteria bacterium]